TVSDVYRARRRGSLYHAALCFLPRVRGGRRQCRTCGAARGQPHRGRGVRVLPARVRVRDGVGDPVAGRPGRPRLGPDPRGERRGGRPHRVDSLATASAGPGAPGWGGRRRRVTWGPSTP